MCGVQQQQQVAARTSVEASASGFPFTLINTCHIAFRIQRDGVEGGGGGNNMSAMNETEKRSESMSNERKEKTNIKEGRGVGSRSQQLQS